MIERRKGRRALKQAGKLIAQSLLQPETNRIVRMRNGQSTASGFRGNISCSMASVGSGQGYNLPTCTNADTDEDQRRPLLVNGHTPCSVDGEITGQLTTAGIAFGIFRPKDSHANGRPVSALFLAKLMAASAMSRAECFSRRIRLPQVGTIGY